VSKRKGGTIAVVYIEVRQVCVLYAEALGHVLPDRGRRERRSKEIFWGGDTEACWRCVFIWARKMVDPTMTSPIFTNAEWSTTGDGVMEVIST
jgi:hypothetical protein